MSDVLPITDRRMLELLGKSGLFAALPESDLSVVAEYGAFRSCRAGAPVFRQGTRARELYIVAEGAVVVRKAAGDGQEQELARFTAGEVLGEIDLLDTVPRNASAYADGPATVLVFPADGLSFRDIVEGHPQIFAPVLHTLLGTVASRIRAANRLLSDRTPWIRELQKQLHRDRLTGLYNRTWLDDELDNLLRRRPRTSVLVVKPDNFKAVNDTYGHDAGDRVLLMSAEVLKAFLADGELGARYRGDENCVILPDAGASEAARRGDQLRRAIAAMDLRDVTGGAPLRFTASVGVATWPEHAPDARRLLAVAFERMQAARAAGGDRTCRSDTP